MAVDRTVTMNPEKRLWTERHVEQARQKWLHTPRWRIVDRWIARRNYRQARDVMKSVTWHRDINNMRK